MNNNAKASAGNYYQRLLVRREVAATSAAATGYGLMVEEADAGEGHDHAIIVTGGDHIVIAQ
ncbi:hypothetical protein KDW_34880 [Dictyobacter vulcani]|uniref:Uncharacterized protein n=1 Tax=Dictyobacter vulcani TaxID=2607529 RepID=A0A5J4KVU7_9CHLR|nr:hypothetical protein KDW_34880 [Dictyobacter vulcani]